MQHTQEGKQGYKIIGVADYICWLQHSLFLFPLKLNANAGPTIKPNTHPRPGTVAQVYDPSTQEAEARGSQFPGLPELHSERLTKKMRNKAKICLFLWTATSFLYPTQHWLLLTLILSRYSACKITQEVTPMGHKRNRPQLLLRNTQN